MQQMMPGQAPQQDEAIYDEIGMIIDQIIAHAGPEAVLQILSSAMGGQQEPPMPEQMPPMQPPMPQQQMQPDMMAPPPMPPMGGGRTVGKPRMM